MLAESTRQFLYVFSVSLLLFASMLASAAMAFYQKSQWSLVAIVTAATVAIQTSCAFSLITSPQGLPTKSAISLIVMVDASALALCIAATLWDERKKRPA